MKIAQIVCTYPPYRGGMGNVAYNFTESLRSTGNEVSVFTPDYGNTKISSEKKVFRIKPFLKYGNAAFVPQLVYHLYRGKFDIIHLHYPFFGGMEVVWLYKKIFKHKTKLVIHYHMEVVGLAWYLELLRLPSRLINNSLFKIADGITCASIDYVKNNDYNKVYLRNKNKYFEIPFGIDTKKFSPCENKKKQILFVGGMDSAHYFKGVDVLLKAFSRLKNDEYSLVLVGNGDLVEAYKKLATELNIGRTTVFAENVNNETLVKYYQESCVLVLSSINNCEAFGVVLLEAMACGTPVIASSLPGVRTVFKNGEQGFYFETNNINDLSNKLKQIIYNEELRKSMGQKARDLILKQYDKNIINIKLIDYYTNIL